MGVRRANSDLLFVCDTYFTGCFYFITSLNLDDEALTLWATCNCRDFFEKSWFAVVGLQLVYPSPDSAGEGDRNRGYSCSWLSGDKEGQET